MSNIFPARMVLSQVAHRPWPRPMKPWVLKQSWHRLLFAHWPVDAHRLRTRLPAGLELELRDGIAWLGIVAFETSNAAPRWIPPLPGVSAFPELNVRTYVTHHGKPGIYFLSLDARSSLFVWFARTFLRLPYFGAQMEVKGDGEWLRYRSVRKRERAEFQARYRPWGEPHEARTDALESFLLERYCLYNLGHARQLYRVQIQHPPWQVQPVEARIGVNTVADVLGISLPGAPPLLHYAERQDMVAYFPERA